MPSQRGKPKGRFVIYLIMASAALIIFSYTGLRLGSISLLSPLESALLDSAGYLQKVFSSPINSVKGFWSSYAVLRDVKQENAALKDRIANLQRQLNEYREALIANARYRQLLNLKKKNRFKSVVANVVGLDLAPWSATLIIDQGRNSGIRPGMPAMAGPGIIGKVIESGLGFSRIMLVSDYSNAVAAMVQRNRVRGILKGAGHGGCILAYVEKGIDVEVGDQIITSGTDGVFPKGFLLGEVLSVSQGPAADLFQDITVKPVMDLGKIEEVMVLMTRSNFLETKK